MKILLFLCYDILAREPSPVVFYREIQFSVLKSTHSTYILKIKLKHFCGSLESPQQIFEANQFLNYDRTNKQPKRQSEIKTSKVVISVASSEIAHLGSCHLGKYPWEIAIWEEFFGKVPNIFFVTLAKARSKTEILKATLSCKTRLFRHK